MSAPRPVVRAVVYERDNNRCVSCGSYLGLQFQHRKATGMGGSKIKPLYVDGVTSCFRCNPRYESDLQAAALRFGWKVRANSPLFDPALVPVWYVTERAWFVLTRTGGRRRVVELEALGMMHSVYGDEYSDWDGEGK